MIDPLSFTASLVAISGLVGTVFRTSQFLYQVAEDISSAREDIEKFALDMRNFGIVIEMGHNCLERFCATCKPASPLFKYFNDLDVLESLAQETELTRNSIRRARRKTSTQSRTQAFAHFKWVFRKRHLDSLHPGMEKLKSNFSLMMSYVTFEMLQKREDSEETRQELISLKRQIQLHLDTIDLLQQSEKRRMRESGEPQEIYNSHSASAGHQIQDKLSFLGAQIMEHDAVPDPKEYTPFSSRVFSNDHFNDEYGRRTSVPYAQSSPSSNARSRRTERSTSTATSPISSIATTVESKEVRVSSKRPPELRHKRRQIPSRHEPQSSDTSRVSVSSDHLSLPLSPTEEPQKRKFVNVEGDFISVGPKNPLLRFNANRPIRSIQGYVNTDNGPVSTTAKLDKSIDYNLISVADVKRFGLEMEQPNDEEPVRFQTDEGEKKSCGQVVMEWSDGLRNRRPFRVRCFVYGHDVRPLLFGKPFLERKKHYWGSDIEVEEEEVEEEVEGRLDRRKGKERAV